MNHLHREGKRSNARRQHTWAHAALLALIAAAPLSATAQTNGSNSPYSRYGFGLLSDRAQGFNKGMAGLAYGMRNGKELNVKNPASYSAIDSMSFIFDAGFSLQNANLDQGGVKTNARNTSFDYLSMGFRATKNLGISLGIMPFSTIGYSMSNSSEMADNPDITQTDTYAGDGGLHEVYVGAGWAPFRFASVGVNVGYLWGDMTHTITAAFSESTVASRRRQYSADIRTYKVDAGLQFTGRIDRHNSFVLGLTYGLGHNINSNGLYYDQRIQSSTTVGDTITAHNPYTLPHTFGAGLTWDYNHRLRVGIDYNWQKWSSAKAPALVETADGGVDYTATKNLYSDMHKVTVGAEYVPDADGLTWRSRVRYRLGFSYTSPYTKIGGEKGPKDYLVSAGVGIPIINSINNRSFVNVAVQYERVKPQVSGHVTEQYLRLCIGLTFNERWFMKWKVE